LTGLTHFALVPLVEGGIGLSKNEKKLFFKNNVGATLVAQI
jgi:hypothetical protein